MKTFSMKCSCGDEMTMEAETREAAIQKFKDMMDEEMIKKHMDEKHPGEPMISVADCHAMVESEVKEV